MASLPRDGVQSGISRLLRSYVGVHFALEDRKGYGARREHDIVEVLGLVPRPQSRFRFVPEPEDLELADLIRECLAGIDDVAFDLAGFDAVVDRLLARPAHRVQPGVDDQPTRPEQLAFQLPEQPFGIALVPSFLRDHPLRVKGPALADGGDAAERARLAELRQPRVLHGEGRMEVMPGDGLVIDERAQAELRHAGGAQRHLVDARPRAVERWRRVAGRSAGPAELWIRLRDDPG